MTSGSVKQAPSAETLLVARSLTVGYGGTPVLRGVELEVRRHECIALVGANGSGKTTLFRTLLHILPPLAGEIAYRSSGALGYVPQRDQLDTLIPLTVAEVVRMGAYRRWRPFQPLPASRIATVLAKVGGTGWERRVLGELSGGERQRVLIARALIAEPDLLLLDEPTTGIDAASEAAIFGELKRCRAAGLGIVMVSHDLAGLGQVATRALVIRGGRVEEVPVEYLDTPDAMRALLSGGGTRE